MRPDPHFPSLRYWLVPLLFTVGQAASAQDDFAVNRLLASQCAQCHGTDGYARGDIDEIAGEEARDLYEDLADMKGEDRPENIMDHQALGYTDDQIRRIAAYFATLPEQARSGEGEYEPEDGEASGAEADTRLALESESRERRLDDGERDEDDEDDEDDEEDEEEREEEDD